ncbi:MAG TPA: hypothetical protein VFS43_26670 [Polyangiaceae bacterium]|nr:hypothetical protein [Polyangiaceae bacterium]
MRSAKLRAPRLPRLQAASSPSETASGERAETKSEGTRAKLPVIAYERATAGA